MRISPETLFRRAKYGGRKGRRAVRRLRAMDYDVTIDATRATAWHAWSDALNQLVECLAREAFAGTHIELDVPRMSHAP